MARVALVDRDEEARHAAPQRELDLGAAALGGAQRLVEDRLRLRAIARAAGRAPRQRQQPPADTPDRDRWRDDRRAPPPPVSPERLGDAAEIVVVARQLLGRHGVARRRGELDQPLAGAVRLGVAAEQVQLLRQAEVRLGVRGRLLLS